jgi:hypothetical protein
MSAGRSKARCPPATDHCASAAFGAPELQVDVRQHGDEADPRARLAVPRDSRAGVLLTCRPRAHAR